MAFPSILYIKKRSTFRQTISPILKRSFDIIFSVSILALASPLYLLIALLIKLSSKGPIFYSQNRIGQHHMPFKIYKFRTMYLDADQRLQALLRRYPKLQKEFDCYHKLRNDPRTTFIGKLLRTFSLDEMPQFFNVLKGDLSVIGPRPLCQYEIDKMTPQLAKTLLSIKPGLSCLWVLAGRNNISFEKRMELEQSYVLNRSFLLDIYIIIKTIPAMLFPRGAC